MEKVDFDQLCKKAYPSEASLQDKDNLWLELFKLEQWHFIAQGTVAEISPYVGEAKKIEPDSQWLYCFTDSNRATYFAKRANLRMDDLNSPVISVPNNSELMEWLDKFIAEGVKGIFYNADGSGFYVPLTQISAIRKHLVDSFSSEF